MAGLIPQNFVHDLLNRSDILDIVGSRIQLKKNGKDYSACCPFHNEKTPSFTVSPDKQFYHCFGCQAHGNALDFIMKYDQVDFPQAVEDLARKAGVEVPREQGPGNRPRTPTDSALYPLLQAAADFYRQALKSHPARRAAVDYLKARGLSGTIARDFALGFAPPGWDSPLFKHLGGDPLQQKIMLEAGLLREKQETGKHYDFFRDRVMFPIRDSRGRVIAFGGRVLGNDKPKYLNSPETQVFHKGRELYGLFEARQHNRDLQEILVVEGYMDVIALAQHGLRNAVATLGTATSEEHLKRIFRVVHNVLFCFDGDKAGRHAAWRALEATLPNLKDGYQARFLFLPEGEDPDSLIRREGKDAFLARIAQQAQPLADYLFEQLLDEADPNSLEGKAHLAALASPLIEQVPGNFLRTLMQQRLQQITGLHSEPTEAPYAAKTSPSLPTPETQAPSGQFKPYRKPPQTRPPQPSYRSKAPSVGVQAPSLVALRILLHRPDLASQIDGRLLPAPQEDPYAQLLTELLQALHANPALSTVQLLARWHGTEQGRQLRQLADKEWLITAGNLEQLFFDTINRLRDRQREQSLETLLAKTRHGELSSDEKDQLKILLQRNELGVSG